MKQRTLARPARSAFRKYWTLGPDKVFLNHGSFGACPAPILELQAELRRQMEAEPVQFLWRRYEERLEPSRSELAGFIGARSSDVVFITNSTTGVNAVARSLKLRRGDEIVTTNHDYNACHNVLVEAARRAGARLVVAQVPFPVRHADEIVEGILRVVTPRTRLAMIDHVTSDTALVFPLARIIRELDSRGVDTLVDGAHAPGMVPLDLQRLRPAYYAGNLHKWVCAPKGAAFLWARQDKQANLQPAVISHGNNRPRRGYSAFQDRFDWAGTFDPTAWFCVGEAIRWMGNLLPGGWRELRKRNRDLAVAARRFLCRQLDVEAPCPDNLIGSMATVPLPRWLQTDGTDSGAARTKNGVRSVVGKMDREQVRLYDEFGIEVPFSRIGELRRRYLRISAHLHNSLSEYEYLAEALRVLS